jgi:hypothetical protein
MRPVSLALMLALTPGVLPAQQPPARTASTPPLEVGAVLQPAGRHPVWSPGQSGQALGLQGEDGSAGLLLQGPNQRLNGADERVP